MKSLHRILFALFLAVSAISGCTDPVEEVPVTISLNKELMTALPAGSEQQLVATVRPEGADVTLVWKSDNEAVATVDADGLVKGLKPGEAKITVSAEDAVAECRVVVVNVKPVALKLSHSDLRMTVDDEVQLDVELTPAESVAEDLEWVVDKKDVVSVTKGLVKAVGEGSATVTVKCNGGNLAAVCRITVSKEYVPVYVTDIELEPSEVEMQVGDRKTIKITYLPEGAEAVTDLVWESSEPSVASVTDGTIEALKAGSTTVTATCMGGEVTAECKVTVTDKPDPGPGQDELLSVAIMADVYDVQVTETLQLELVCTPSDVVPTKVTWSVDDPSLASIDENGLLTGIWTEKNSVSGDWNKVVVTAHADTKETSISIRVIPRQADRIDIDLPEGSQLRMGDWWNFNPRVYPDNLGFSILAVSNPFGNISDDGRTTHPLTPGNYDYTFTLSGHENLVESYIPKVNASISVIPYWVESVSVPASQEMEVGTSMTLIPTFMSDVQGHEPSYKDVRWKSSAPAVVSVDENSGEMKALATGTAEITVTTVHDWAVPSGSSHKSSTCVVTVLPSDASLNVGDYYYSDGTWSSDLDTAKEVVGVVFAKINATTSDPLLARDYPDCTHGLVVSTVEYAAMDFGYVSTYDGHGYYTGQGYDAVSIVDTDKPNGYGNTLAHAAVSAAHSDYCTLFNPESGVVAGHRGKVPSPAGASSWYVPSFKEMSLLNENRETVNAAMSAAGGDKVAEPYQSEVSWDGNRSSDWYWSSTIYGMWNQGAGCYYHYKFPFDISKGGWTTTQQTSGSFNVRVILAF